MSEQNTNSVETNGIESNGRAKKVVQLFASYEEAEPCRPESAKAEAWKVFRVTRPNGEEVYVWAFTGIQAINDVGRIDGYSAEAATRKSRVLTVETAAAKVKELPLEERMAMLFSPEELELIKKAKAKAGKKS